MDKIPKHPKFVLIGGVRNDFLLFSVYFHKFPNFYKIDVYYI